MLALALRLQKTSSRRLGKDQYICLSHASSRCLQDVFKTSSRRLQSVLQKRLQDIFKKSSRRFEDVFERSSTHLQDVLPRRLQDVLKNIFKTSSRCLQDVLQRYLQDVFKAYHQVKLFLLTRL